MRVLLIDVNCKSSSTGKIVYDLYSQLNNDGHKAAICYGRGPLIDEPNIYKFSSNLEVNFHAFLTRITGLTGYFSFFATKNLIKFIEDFKPDVVHIHELHAYFVNVSPLIEYLKKKNIKTIWTFHCEFMYTGKCGHAYDCDKWKTECNDCPQLRQYPKSWFFDFTRKMFRDKKRLLDDFDNLTIVAPSNWLADRVKQSFLGDKDIRVIHNGIDTDNIFFSRPFDHLKEKHKLTDEKIIMAVAPNLMADSKGGKWVLELAKKFKDDNVKFILIGVEDLKQAFDENVIPLGRTSNQIELAEYYSLADVFVIFSSKETFSLTCAEALCCGTPMAGFKAGAPETIFEEPYAKFVEYGDVEGMKLEVLNFINRPIKRDKVSSYGTGKYSKEKMYYEYISTYAL